MIRRVPCPGPKSAILYSSLGSFFLLDERGYGRLAVLIGHLCQHHVTSVTFDQGRDCAVLRPGPRSPSQWPGTARSSTAAAADDQTMSLICPRPSLMRPACFDGRIVRLEPKMTKQLFLQRPSGLKQIDCDRSSRVARDNARLQDQLFHASRLSARAPNLISACSPLPVATTHSSPVYSVSCRPARAQALSSAKAALSPSSPPFRLISRSPSRASGPATQP